MDWKLLAPLLVTAIITIVGWFVAHRLNARRDQANKRREQRVQYLIEAYRRLAKAVHHSRLYEVADEVQSAIADIQLFGNEEQIQQVVAFVKEMAEKKEASLDNLLNTLR